MEHGTKRDHPLYQLITRYEAMAQHGNIPYLDEKEFVDIIRFYCDETSNTKALEIVDVAIDQHAYCVDFLLIKARQQFLHY